MVSAESMNKVVDFRRQLPVSVENGLCSRFRCTKSSCSACADVCPVRGAVRFLEHGVEITDGCVACGACASACPNGAIRPIESDQNLAKRIRNRVRPAAAFRIACTRAEGRVDVVLPCLSRLTEAILLEPIRGGAARVELLGPDCPGCWLEKAAPQWKKVLTLSRDLCESAGLGAGRVVRVSVPSGKPEETHVPSNSRNSRRAMFQAIAARWTASSAAAAMPDTGPEQTPAEPFRDIVQRHHENLKRSDLLEMLRALPGAKLKSKVVPAAGTPLADLDIGRQCVGCNVCETLCPTGALQHREEVGTYALDFEAALCTGCRICEVACFYKAIRVRETVDLSVLFERPKATLVSAARRTCKACRETFLDGSSELCPLCLVSSRRREMVARRILFGGKPG